MASTDRRVDRGRRQARETLRALGRELRGTRLDAGLSQARLGAVVGISGAHVGRVERAEVPSVSVTLLTSLFAALGNRLTARAYPEGPPIRDAAHASLLLRFRHLLAPTLRFRTEVPVLPGTGIRAWDAEVARDGDCVKVEAETAIHDIQALDRRIGLKMSDGGVERVILLVADTKRNRRIVREFRELLRERYPLDPRTVLADLRAGRIPAQGGLVIL